MKVVLLTATALTLGAGTARADLRSFTHTYEYATMPEGKTSLELAHTQTRSGSDSNSAQIFESVFEIEHGITEHWDMAFYQVFDQVADGPMSEAFHLDEVKLETRYRFAERGEWPVDTLVYLELAKDFGESVYEIEGKVIGARDFGDVTVAANAIVEIAVGKDTEETEPEVGWAAGATYEAQPKIRVGVETWGEVEEEELYASAGPVVNVAPASNFWATLTLGYGLTEEVHGAEFGFFSARVIFGIEL
jgi:hypothetical protein